MHGQRNIRALGYFTFTEIRFYKGLWHLVETETQIIRVCVFR